MKNNNNNAPTLSQVKKLNYTHVSRICIYRTKITNGVLNLALINQFEFIQLNFGKRSASVQESRDTGYT